MSENKRSVGANWRTVAKTILQATIHYLLRCLNSLLRRIVLIAEVATDLTTVYQVAVTIHFGKLPQHCCQYAFDPRRV